jgi:DegV family protein with EDD domain
MVRLITDSAADCEPFELEKLNIACIPIKVMLADTEYEENVSLSKDQFFALLKETGASPKTSQPAPAVLMDFFDDAKKAGEEALYISLSSGISGTYQTARMTCEDADSDLCFVLDSLNATGGQRLQLEYAARLRDEGKSAAEIMEAVKAIQGKIVLYACMDTLEYLYRGGRISQTVYKLGTMAQVKPILRVTEAGAIEVPAKAMGMRKGMDFLCKRVEARKPDLNHNFYAMYTGDRSNGVALAEKFRAMGYDIPDEKIINVGAAIGSHVGPNACGMVYVAE